MKTEQLNVVAFPPVFKQSAHQQAFLRDGFAVVDFLEPAQIERLWDVWKHSSGELNHLPFSSTVFSRNLDYRRTMYEHVLAEFHKPARDLLRGYRLCACGFVNKLPQNEHGEVELHQDPAVVDELRYFGVGIWCPLVDVNMENGCLRVVPGSHLINRGPRESMNIDFPYPALLPCIEEHYLVDVPMKAGQAFIYTQALFHSSLPNHSTTNRLVAGALALPEETPIMIYVRNRELHPGRLAAYKVSDDFYRGYFLGNAPDESFRVGFVEDEPEFISEDCLHEILRGRLAI